MKKSLIFGLAAATCAAWILVGCESPTDGEKGAAGANAPGTLPPDAKPELLAAYFASTDKVFLVADLDEGTFVVPAGKTLAVVGDVTLNNSSVINAYAGNFDVSAGSIGGANAVFIVRNPSDYDATEITSGIIPAYAAGVSDTPIAGDTVLPSLTLGGSGTSEEDFGDFAGSTYTVYVMGDLTIDATTALTTGNAKLTVLGETTAAGAGGVTFGANTEIGTLKATGALTITAVGAGGVKKLDLNGNPVTITNATNIGEITSSATDGSLALAATPTIAKLAVGASDITVTSATTTSLTVSTFSTDGTGKLVLPKETVSFTATAGGGNFSYSGNPASVTASSTTGLTYVGNLSTGAVTLTAGNLTVSGNAAFTGALTGPAGSSATITFNGETASVASYTTKEEASADTFAGTAALTITTLTDTSSGASKVTFNGTGLAKIMNAFTVNTGGLTIAGTGFVDVENETEPTLTNALSIANTGGVHFEKLVVNTGNAVTLTKAVLKSGNATPISLANNAALTLNDGDVLALATTGTIAVEGSGKIAIGAHGEISGVGTWTATAGTDEYVAITSLADVAFIGASKRDASTAETAGTLAATDGTAGVIKVAAQKTLVLGAKTTINVGGTSTRVGAIVLAETDGTAPANLVFGGAGAQIITGVAADGTVLTGANGAFVAVSGNAQDKGHVSAFTGGNHLVITADSTGTYLASIVYGAGAPYITGPENSAGGDFTISVATDPVS